jgi:hypothetical protein
MSVSESRLELGRLGPFVEGYRVWLLERGYSPGTVEHELRVLGVLGRWMVAEDLAVGQLDGDVIAAFVDAHRVNGRVAAVVARPALSEELVRNAVERMRLGSMLELPEAGEVSDAVIDQLLGGARTEEEIAGPGGGLAQLTKELVSYCTSWC